MRVGSVLDIPDADATYDFVYMINVLHHLASVDEQRARFAESDPRAAARRPAVRSRDQHANVSVPLLHGLCVSIAELHRRRRRALAPAAPDVEHYTDAPVVDIRYFTFLPDFLAGGAGAHWLLARLSGCSRRRRCRVYSAHYMAVLRKPA